MSTDANEEAPLPVVEAYNRWAQTYDSDGNFLQRVDDELVSELLASVLSADSDDASRSVECVVDLGCGTGRNTEKLVRYPETTIRRVVGLDAAPGMLAQARVGRAELAKAEQGGRLRLAEYDLIMDEPPVASILGAGDAGADGVLSTLVLEHIPSLPLFFARASAVLRPGGWFVLTNMHAELGAVTGANFVDAAGATRRTDKHVWAVDEVVRAARAGGFAMRGAPVERRVRDAEHARALGGSAGKHVGRNVLFGMVFVKKADGDE